MLPMTNPVAEVSPNACAFSWFRGDSGGSGGAGGAGSGRVVASDIGTPLGKPADDGTVPLRIHFSKL
jgi:hypothetical protein